MGREGESSLRPFQVFRVPVERIEPIGVENNGNLSALGDNCAHELLGFRLRREAGTDRQCAFPFQKALEPVVFQRAK
jgi:hypothetical protein